MKKALIAIVKAATSKIVVIWLCSLLTASLFVTFDLGYKAIEADFQGALPWVTAGLGIFDGALALVIGKYFDMAKSDHSEGGITFESAKARNFDRDL